MTKQQQSKGDTVVVTVGAAASNSSQSSVTSKTASGDRATGMTEEISSTTTSKAENNNTTTAAAATNDKTRRVSCSPLPKETSQNKSSASAGTSHKSEDTTYNSADFDTLWTSLKQQGWYVYGDKWVKPPHLVKNKVREHKVDYFLSEEEIVEYCREHKEAVSGEQIQSGVLTSTELAATAIISTAANTKGGTTKEKCTNLSIEKQNGWDPLWARLQTEGWYYDKTLHHYCKPMDIARYKKHGVDYFYNPKEVMAYVKERDDAKEKMQFGSTKKDTRTPTDETIASTKKASQETAASAVINPTTATAASTQAKNHVNKPAASTTAKATSTTTPEQNKSAANNNNKASTKASFNNKSPKKPAPTIKAVIGQGSIHMKKSTSSIPVHNLIGMGMQKSPVKAKATTPKETSSPLPTKNVGATTTASTETAAPDNNAVVSPTPSDGWFVLSEKDLRTATHNAGATEVAMKQLDGPQVFEEHKKRGRAAHKAPLQPKKKRRKKGTVRSFSTKKKGRRVPSNTTVNTAVVAKKKPTTLAEKWYQEQLDRQRRNLPNALDDPPKPRRNRKKDPDVIVYVEPTENDVLLGRGGIANNNPGNWAYRRHVASLHEQYKSLDNRDDKTAMSEAVITWVHEELGGRFLKRNEDDESLWYEVTWVTAREKCSQALRDDYSPEARSIKKAKYPSTSKPAQKPQYRTPPQQLVHPRSIAPAPSVNRGNLFKALSKIPAMEKEADDDEDMIDLSDPKDDPSVASEKQDNVDPDATETEEESDDEVEEINMMDDDGDLVF